MLLKDDEDESTDGETTESDSLTELVSFDHTVRTGEEETPLDDVRQQPRVIELFDTPPSQRAMASTTLERRSARL